MRKSFLLFALAAAVMSSQASAADRICQGAVSVASCADHRAYVATLHEIQDTSPDYMKRYDPRYNEGMRTAGGGGGDGGGQ